MDEFDEDAMSSVGLMLADYRIYCESIGHRDKEKFEVSFGTVKIMTERGEKAFVPPLLPEDTGS